MKVYFKARTISGESVVFNPDTLRWFNILPYSVYRCTMLVASNNVLIYECDRIEIFDKSGGEALYKGMVIYNTRKAAFILYDGYGKPVSDLPLGDLCKDRIINIVGD